jgi:transposase
VRSDMEIWKEIRRQVLTKELSQRAALKKYGLGWHTLKKILAHAEPPGYRQSKARPKRKLEPFLAVINQILEEDRQAPKKQRHTAKRIFERLREEHGYQGGKTVVKDTVRAWKQSHQEVFLPLSHPPGEAQVDFGEATIWLAGQETKVALFVMTLTQGRFLSRPFLGNAPRPSWKGIAGPLSFSVGCRSASATITRPLR